MGLARACNVVHAILVADHTSAWVQDVEVRKTVDGWLDGTSVEAQAATPDRETWGTGPEAEQALQAAMRSAGRVQTLTRGG